jgi:hypothetical protein
MQTAMKSIPVPAHDTSQNSSVGAVDVLVSQTALAADTVGQVKTLDPFAMPQVAMSALTAVNPAPQSAVPMVAAALEKWMNLSCLATVTAFVARSTLVTPLLAIIGVVMLPLGSESVPPLTEKPPETASAPALVSVIVPTPLLLIQLNVPPMFCIE